MRISGIIKESIVDGIGIRTTIFFQGCKHNCLGCHNLDTHSFELGKEMTLEEVFNKYSDHQYIDGITLSGGDPFFQLEEMYQLIKLTREKRPDLDIWVYTGYTFEELIALAETNKLYLEVLKNIDVLVDGKFILKQRDISLQFKGSSNQRLIDVQQTLKNKDIVLILD